MSQQAMNVGPYILEHKTCAYNHPSALDVEVNALLKAGWVIHAPMTNVGDQFVVTMIKVDPRMRELLEATLDMTTKQLAAMR